MNSKLELRVLSAALVGVMAGFGAGCSKSSETGDLPASSVSVGTEIDDGVITTKIKSAFLEDPAVKSYDLKVETRKGEVLLNGFVDSQSQIDRAVAVARGVAGVKNVDNKVTLKGSPTTVGAKVDDAIVTTRIKTALLADSNVKSLDIAVVTRQGEVQISGFVNSQTQIDQAMDVARRTEGVVSVINLMSIKK